MAFEKLCLEDPRICILNKTMDREEILGLIQSCDAYVSPHRAEGFGRTLAEAMMFGKPVIATNYSGNQFFMSPEFTFPVDYELIPMEQGDYHFVDNGDGAVWADPQISSMSDQMRAAIERAGDRKYVDKLKKYASTFFAPSRTGEHIEGRFSDLKNILKMKSD